MNTKEVDRLTYTMEQASDVSNVGRTALFAAIKAGELPSIKVGKRRLISAEALKNYVRKLEQGANVKPGRKAAA